MAHANSYMPWIMDTYQNQSQPLQNYCCGWLLGLADAAEYQYLN